MARCGEGVAGAAEKAGEAEEGVGVCEGLLESGMGEGVAELPGATRMGLGEGESARRCISSCQRRSSSRLCASCRCCSSYCMTWRSLTKSSCFTVLSVSNSSSVVFKEDSISNSRAFLAAISCSSIIRFCCSIFRRSSIKLVSDLGTFLATCTPPGPGRALDREPKSALLICIAISSNASCSSSSRIESMSSCSSRILALIRSIRAGLS